MLAKPRSLHRSLHRALWLTATLLFGVCALAAEPTTRLNGSVLDAQGKPLAGVPVGILLREEVQALRKAQPKLVLATRSDPSGKFQLSLPQSLGRAMVVAHSSGLVSGEAFAKLDAQQLELPPLRLLPGLTLSGRVSDAAGHALAGAKISGDGWLVADSTVGSLRSCSAQTRQDGSFVCTGLETGVYRVRAELIGYGTWKSSHVIIQQEAEGQQQAKGQTLEITLHFAAYLSGVVTDPSGRPLSGAKLAERGADPKDDTLSDGAGRFRLGPFGADDEAPVTVSLAGYTSLGLLLKAPKSELQLVLSRSGVLRGRVVDIASGTPLPEARIVLQWRTDDPSPLPDPRASQPVTARDGRFELKDMAAGPATITVMARGYLPRDVQGIEIIPGEPTPEVLVEMQRGITLRGRVIDKQSGKPVDGVRISYGDAAMANNREASGQPRITSDARGSFALEGLPAGNLTINVESFDHLAVSRRMVLAQDSSAEFALSPGATIAGQVLAADGITPVEGWMSVAGPKSFGTNTGQNGRFELKHLPAGRYRVSASTRGQVTPEQEVVVTEDQRLDGMRLVLQTAPMIRGTITGLSAAELRQLQLDVGLAQKVPDGRWGWQTSLIQRSTEAEVEGTTYRLDPHYSGLVVAVAGPAQGPQVHKRIAVPERGDVTVDFNFAGGLEVTGRVTRAGKPAADILMWALPDEGQPVAGFTQTTASGEYRFVDLAPGRYRISPANVKPVRLQMTGKVTQDFELPALEVAGRVADATTGQPLRSVRVELRTTQAEAETEYRSVLTDREGDFKLDLLAAGDYVLTLQRAGYDMTRQELTLRSSLESLTLPLRAAEGVRLRVHGPDLGNLSSAIITERVGAKVVAVVPVSLDLSATGKIPPSLTGRTFTIDAPGYEPFTVSTWDGNPLDVELRESKRQ